jgi:hypothetical protein
MNLTLIGLQLTTDLFGQSRRYLCCVGTQNEQNVGSVKSVYSMMIMVQNIYLHLYKKE